MNIRFLKDVTVEVLEPGSTDEETINRLYREGVLVEADELVPVSRMFTSIRATSGDYLIDLRNDAFEVIYD